MNSTAPLLALTALVAPVVAQQRPIQNVSVSVEAHTDARLSPDGQWIAYRGAGRFGVTAANGSGDSTLLASPNLSEAFVWSPNSATLYVADGSRVLAVNRASGSSTALAMISGQGVRLWLWSVDSTNQTLYGTRYDAATFTYHVFALDTTGTAAPLDIVSTQDAVFDARIDPSGRFVIFGQQGTQPFDPVSFKRVDADGQNLIDFVGAPVGLNASSPRWLDQGDTIVYAGLDAGSLASVMRVDRIAQQPEPLTSFVGHRRINLSADGRWIVFEAEDALGGNGPAVMPATGGGLVYLYTRQGYQYTGSPTIDDGSNTVVFGARRFGVSEAARLWRLDLDGEMRVHPRAEIGNVVFFDLPASAQEVGVIFLGLRGAPFQLAGMQWDFELGSSWTVLTIAQGGPNGISFPAPLPAIPALQGLRVDFQGLRWTPATQTGVLTRFGTMTIF